MAHRSHAAIVAMVPAAMLRALWQHRIGLHCQVAVCKVSFAKLRLPRSPPKPRLPNLMCEIFESNMLPTKPPNHPTPPISKQNTQKQHLATETWKRRPGKLQLGRGDRSAKSAGRNRRWKPQWNPRWIWRWMFRAFGARSSRKHNSAAESATDSTVKSAAKSAAQIRGEIHGGIRHIINPWHPRMVSKGRPPLPSCTLSSPVCQVSVAKLFASCVLKVLEEFKGSRLFHREHVTLATWQMRLGRGDLAEETLANKTWQKRPGKLQLDRRNRSGIQNPQSRSPRNLAYNVQSLRHARNPRRRRSTPLMADGAWTNIAKQIGNFENPGREKFQFS